jgi:hypothetical protein
MGSSGFDLSSLPNGNGENPFAGGEHLDGNDYDRSVEPCNATLKTYRKRSEEDWSWTPEPLEEQGGEVTQRLEEPKSHSLVHIGAFFHAVGNFFFSMFVGLAHWVGSLFSREISLEKIEDETFYGSLSKVATP